MLRDGAAREPVPLMAECRARHKWLPLRRANLKGSN